MLLEQYLNIAVQVVLEELLVGRQGVFDLSTVPNLYCKCALIECFNSLSCNMQRFALQR